MILYVHFLGDGTMLWQVIYQCFHSRSGVSQIDTIMLRKQSGGVTQKMNR